MKHKKKIEATVEICAPGFHIPEGSSWDSEIGKLARRQGICDRIEVQNFVKSVKYRLKKNRQSSAQCAPSVRDEEPARVPKKSYKLLLLSVVIITILFVFLRTMLSAAEETSITTKPRFRVCLTLFGKTVADAESVKTFSNE